MDVELLKEVIQNKGLKLQYVAKKLGLTGYGLNLKLSGKNDFKVSEANKLIEILNLSKDEIFSIFFTSYSHLKWTKLLQKLQQPHKNKEGERDGKLY